ncbi:MAG: rhodanese [Crocinitomicaceae bacterium]|nr:rhodanese [Crocinitomicaceae bacterium]|tara:strand:- start:12432 stop:12848 length:417 start_codon:yes stop_codon:yes gene_type:complete
MLNGLLDHSVVEVSVIDIDQKDGTIYLDAREQNEYKVSHIEGAIWVGYDHFQKDSLKSINKDQKIVVYCSVGYRSEKIAEKLIKMGYTDVANLYGGLFEWSNQKLPLVCGDSNKPTIKIHPYNALWGQWITYGEKVYE